MHHFVQFNNTFLPKYNPFTQAGTRVVAAPVIRMADGRGFDRYGMAQAPQDLGNVVYVGTFYKPQFELAEEQYIKLLGEVGRQGWLYRKWNISQVYNRIMARLMAVDYTDRLTQQAGSKGSARDVRLTFSVVDPVWNGQRYGDYEQALNSMRQSFVNDMHPVNQVRAPAKSVDLNSGSFSTIELINAGNAPVNGVLLYVEALGGTALTGGFRIKYAPQNIEGLPVYDWKITGDITQAASGHCVVDMAAKTASNVGIAPSSRISDFEYQVLHTESHWLTLYPGINEVQIFANSGTFPATGVRFSFHYADGWQ